jgi:hypothetical protein
MLRPLSVGVKVIMIWRNRRHLPMELPLFQTAGHDGSQDKQTQVAAIKRSDIAIPWVDNLAEVATSFGGGGGSVVCQRPNITSYLLVRDQSFMSVSESNSVICTRTICAIYLRNRIFLVIYLHGLYLRDLSAVCYSRYRARLGVNVDA